MENDFKINVYFNDEGEDFEGCKILLDKKIKIRL